LIVAFVTVSLTLMFVVWSSGRFSVYDIIMQALTAPICITTAYWVYKNEMQTREPSPTKP
jgi:hypothetical protein